MLNTPDEIEQALGLLGESLARRVTSHFDLVVVGGAALSILGLGVRPTKDVHVVGLLDGSTQGEVKLVSSRPMAAVLQEAIGEVARALALPGDWMNDGPTDLLDAGLPSGLEERLIARSYGPVLTIHFASRFDLVCLKLYATADSGPGRHLDDLASLSPSTDEMLAAARWACSHDPSSGFLEVVRQLLRQMGLPELSEAILLDDHR